MDILGAQVKHFTFGTGKVITQENNMITIEFAAKTTKFVFPDCFEKFVTATDPNLQERILADIEARMKTKSAAIAPKTKPAGTTSKCALCLINCICYNVSKKCGYLPISVVCKQQ